MGETCVITQVECDAFHRRCRVPPSSISGIELCDRFAVADCRCPSGSEDHLRVEEIGIGRPVYLVSFECIVSYDGIRPVLRRVVPGHLSIPVAHFSLYRWQRWRLGELVVCIVDRLDDGDGCTQLAEIRSIGKSEAETLPIAGFERERPRGKEKRNIVVVRHRIVEPF